MANAVGAALASATFCRSVSVLACLFAFATAACGPSREAKLARNLAHQRYLAARKLLADGNKADGARALKQIAEAAPPEEDTPLAAYELASLSAALEDDPNAWNDMERFVLRFPNSGVAGRALRRLLAHIDETKGKRASIDKLAEIERTLGETELGEAIAYETAKRIAELGNLAAAREMFLSVSKRWPYPHGALFDDSLYHASEIDEQLGRYEDAVRDLQWMLNEREVSWIIGSYQRPLYSPALMRLGTLYRDKLGDRRRAREAFHRLYAEFKTSILRDDALWEEARLWRLDGHAKTACERLETLSREFPTSRYVPCASEHCPELARLQIKTSAKEGESRIKRCTVKSE